MAEKFNFEKKENEITEQEVIDSLIKDPSNYDLYSKWKEQGEHKADKEGTPIANLNLEARAVGILVKALESSFDNSIFFQNTLEALYDTAVMADEQGEKKLSDNLFEAYKGLLAKYDEIFPERS